MGAIRPFVSRIRASGVRRPTTVTTTSMGVTRVFEAYDVGDDTFVFERGILAHLGERPSVLIVEKQHLVRRARGRVFTMSTGNHSVAAFPLLDGRFWHLSHLASAQRGDVLVRLTVCGNVVGDALELSQREVATNDLVRADRWLCSAAGLALGDVVMTERNETTLEHYRRLGQEWRVKPLAWTEAEMRVALAASRKRIVSAFNYYHSARGVHFLSFAEFARVAQLARTDYPAFLQAMRELVSVLEGNRVSFTRMPKYRGHHEIEFFGIRRGLAVERLVPEIEKMMEQVALGRIGQLGTLQRIDEIVALFRSLLTKPAFADDADRAFVETLYMYITGEIYAVVGEGTTPAFDDRRTALPGATFENGRPVMHPGADERSGILLSNLRGLMSKDEIVEYANVYELRGEGADCPVGRGNTREVVYKTNRAPLELSVIEKRLSSAKKDYGSYMFARIGAMRALGISMSGKYLLLRRRRPAGRRPVDFYIRLRCEGEPLDAVPETYFRSADDSGVENRDAVLDIAQLMGEAAAQNMAIKKYAADLESPLFGIGKEIYKFEYDVVRQRVIAKKVYLCSIRGSFGWPVRDFTEENLAALGNFYMGHFAHALKAFARRHTVPMADLAARFMDGFEYRTHALAWKLSVMRDQFEAFDPHLPASYDFVRKWKFVMWALDRQERRLATLRALFLEKVRVIETAASAGEVREPCVSP